MEAEKGHSHLAHDLYIQAQKILDAEETTKYHILQSACYYKIGCLYAAAQRNKEAQ